jgi:HAD superfamily phosphoserine phosphatase-like hydrolase
MKVAIFDFDGTLFPVETIPFLIKQYTRLGYSRFKQITMMARLIPDLVRYKLSRHPDKEVFRHKAVYRFLSLFEGMTKEEVTIFFEKNVDQVAALLDKEVVHEVTQKKSEGYHTVLLSGCFDMLLHPIGEALGFDEIVGTELVFQAFKDQQDRIVSTAPIKIVSGDHKLSAAKNIGHGATINWQESIGYADSYYDQPMLNLVGHKVAVNPDHKLRAIAKEKGWQIMDTKQGQEKIQYS